MSHARLGFPLVANAAVRKACADSEIDSFRCRHLIIIKQKWSPKDRRRCARHSKECSKECMSSVRLCVRLLSGATVKLRDEVAATMSCKCDGDVLQHVSAELRADRDVVLAALARRGLARQCVSMQARLVQKCGSPSCEFCPAEPCFLRRRRQAPPAERCFLRWRRQAPLAALLLLGSEDRAHNQ